MKRLLQKFDEYKKRLANHEVTMAVQQTTMADQQKALADLSAKVRNVHLQPFS